jgi:hypothetical protein
LRLAQLNVTSPADEDGRARVETTVTVDVAAFDWNCAQHITPRFTLSEIEELIAPLHTKIEKLEARLRTVSLSPSVSA